MATVRARVRGLLGPYAAAVAADTPKGYWRLNEREGTTGANSVTGGPSLTYADTRLGEAGVFAAGDDTAAEFNGRSATAQLPGGAFTTPDDQLSVELWFRSEGPGVILGYSQKPFDQNDNPATPMLYVGTDGKLRGQAWSGSAQTITSPGAVNDGLWHHAVLSVEGDNKPQTLYLDGVAVGTIQSQGVVVDPYVTIGSGVLNASAWPSSTGPRMYFTGDIDEVSFYDKALGAGSVKDHYAARGKLLASTAPAYRAAVTGDGPWSYWRLNEPNGGQAVSQQAARTGWGRPPAAAASAAPTGCCRATTRRA